MEAQFLPRKLYRRQRVVFTGRDFAWKNEEEERWFGSRAPLFSERLVGLQIGMGACVEKAWRIPVDLDEFVKSDEGGSVPTGRINETSSHGAIGGPFP